MDDSDEAPQDAVSLEALEGALARLVARMQTPEHRDAVAALFRMSGEDLRGAAGDEGA